MSDPITYKFCIESLRYIHSILGYDTIIQELNFIQHLTTPNIIINPPTPSPSPSPVPAPNPPAPHPAPTLQTNVEVDLTIQSPIDLKDTKNIIIEHKYVRNPIPDDIRCNTILSTDKRCTFKRADNSTHCSRHTK